MTTFAFPFDRKSWNRHALLTAAEMRAAEAATYAKGVSSFSVMQSAGKAIARKILKQWEPRRTLVLCGPGNNGGDGYIVAEELRRAGWNVTIAALINPSEMKGDAALAVKEWQGEVIPLDGISYNDAELVIVALFGTGLTREIEGTAHKALDKLSRAQVPIVAVDLPSGVDANTGQVLGIAAQADMTVTFFRKKIGHALLPGLTLSGDIFVEEIGIEDDVLDAIAPPAAENTADLWRAIFPFPHSGGHKYSRGHALIYGGAEMTGATRLGARAAQRMGAGLVTIATPKSSWPIYAEALESIIVRPADDTQAWRELLNDEKKNAVLIGPGLGTGMEQSNLVLAALDTKKTCVLDADALSNFAENSDALLSKLHANCVLTPHEGEFARLFNKKMSLDDDKLARARAAAKMAGCVILLKGADTVIAAPDGHAVISTNGPPWLATGGSGDVLAGLILGLVAQNMPVFAAAAAGAWVHGAVAGAFGPGLIAEDLVSGLPDILKSLSGVSSIV